VAAAAAILGDNIGFWIGDKGGVTASCARYGHYLRIDEPKLKIGRYISCPGTAARSYFLGRFVSVLRTYAAFLAGTNRMRWPRFLIYNAAGGILMGRGPTALRPTAPATPSGKASATINLALRRRSRGRRDGHDRPRDGALRQAARLAARAEAAYPGTPRAVIPPL